MEEVVAKEVNNDEEEEKESVAFRKAAKFVATRKEKIVSQQTRDDNTAMLEHFDYEFYDYAKVKINFGIAVNEH